MIRKVREAGKERTAGILRNYLTAAYNAARRAPFDSALPSSLIDFRVTINPAEIIPTIAVNRGERVLTLVELRTYFKALGEDAADLALKVALLAGGQRVSQLLRAKVSDFDTETKILRLWDSKGKRAQAREHLLPLAPVGGVTVSQLIRQRRDSDDLIFSIHSQTAGIKVADISKEMGGEPFTLRDIRRTVETQLAGMGVSKDIRAQLLSHGLSGVQVAHYDRYEYMAEKRNALIQWEQHLISSPPQPEPATAPPRWAGSPYARSRRYR